MSGSSVFVPGQESDTSAFEAARARYLAARARRSFLPLWLARVVGWLWSMVPVWAGPLFLLVAVALTGLLCVAAVTP